jgi:hypothetical protein
MGNRGQRGHSVAEINSAGAQMEGSRYTKAKEPPTVERKIYFFRSSVGKDAAGCRFPLRSDLQFGVSFASRLTRNLSAGRISAIREPDRLALSRHHLADTPPGPIEASRAASLGLMAGPTPSGRGRPIESGYSGPQVSRQHPRVVGNAAVAKSSPIYWEAGRTDLKIQPARINPFRSD